MDGLLSQILPHPVECPPVRGVLAQHLHACTASASAHESCCQCLALLCWQLLRARALTLSCFVVFDGFTGPVRRADAHSVNFAPEIAAQQP